MPKTWDKSYQWILEHKEKLDINSQKMSKKADEVEKKHNYALKDIDYKIDECKNQLTNQHNEIVQNQNDLQAQKDELQNNVAKCTKKHKKYTNNQKEAERDEGRNENIIYTQTEIIEINKQTKKNYTKIQKKIIDTSQYVNEGETKLQSKIDYHKQLSDLKRELETADKNIGNHKDYLGKQNQSVKDKLDVQMEQAKSDVDGVSKTHIDTISSCRQFIKQSEKQLSTIDTHCGNMKNSKMPRFDESKLKNCEKEKIKAITELESTRAEYMKL